ncbi:hypothetical protein E2C01_095941 [Portunus trituberculatus]|uniref:Uncharacterized protein n=1 Tax=Portunus trituberculatus TaxID=210409 RepID=A0A5B7K5B6_PORTR|nr:hypothetical protein [Portunus trituberculatus]
MKKWQLQIQPRSPFWGGDQKCPQVGLLFCWRPKMSWNLPHFFFINFGTFVVFHLIFNL